MKSLKNKLQDPSRAIRLGFWLFNLACLLAAVICPDRGTMFQGLGRICTQSAQVTKSYFDPAYGGLAGTFLNAALVGIASALLYEIPGAKRNAVAVLAFFLTEGFAFWGINILNMWFGMVGVLLYCLVKKAKIGTQINAMLFTTGIAPIFTEMLFRYPSVDWHGFTWTGLLMALGVGIFVGFFLPAGLAASAKCHRGFSLYSAALPVGMMGFLLKAVLYQVAGAPLPDVSGVGLGESFWGTANIFCFAIFGTAILLGFWLGATPRSYWRLLRHSGHGVDYSQRFGSANAVLNFGVYGLFITGYYDLIGANWNAVTLGLVFCVVCLCCSGSHPLNVWPIMAGYVLVGIGAKLIFFGSSSFPVSQDSLITVNAQVLAVGLCYATGLAPISGKYGWWWGIVAGGMHCAIVTLVPLLHGGFVLYNGGFTACLVCIMLMPVLEHFCKAREKEPEALTAGAK